MPHVNWLHDETDLIGRGTNALMIGSVVAVFAALVLATTIYDIGDWLGIW